MRYKKNVVTKDFEKALYLEPSQVNRLKNAIAKAYGELAGTDFSIDEINAFVAPYIKTPEEAFFAASIILTDMFGALVATGKASSFLKD